MKTMADQIYGEVCPERQAYDVFLPDPGVANGAAIFFVHGGGFSGGSRRQWHSVAGHFCGLGYVCASTGYRLMPDWIFPTQFEDVRTAMSCFLDRHAEFGFDPRRVASWGSSAGGHLAAMLAVTGPESPRGRTPAMRWSDTRPAAAVCLCTVFSVHREGGYYKPDFVGCTEDEKPQLFSEASPIDHVRGAEPPFLMVTGDADKTTPLAWHTAMQEKLRRHGVRADLKVLPGATHGYGYGVVTDYQKATLKYAEDFLKETILGK